MSDSVHLKERLEHDLKDAMRARDRTRMLVIRSLLTAIMEREKEGRGTLDADELMAVVQKQAKQRRDSMEQFEGAGREDLAQRERDELTILGRYLPKQLTEQEVREVLHDIITRTGASSRNDFGRVMGEAMRELRGQADGGRVRSVLEGLLTD